MRQNRCSLLVGLWILLAAATTRAGPTVLLLWDTQGPQTEALTRALTDSSLKVIPSQTDESSYDGSNPPLDGIDVVVHLNGTTYNTEMPIAGQKALERFVRDGGGYIQHEWDAYQLSVGQMKWMRNLILFDRQTGYSGPITISRLKEQAAHPVVWEVPPTFQIQGGCNVGKVHPFEEDPAVVLARDDRDSDAIAVREFGLGRIVGFHHGGNWNYADKSLLDSREARRLFVDAVLWAHGCGEVYRKGPRQAICNKIAARRSGADKQPPAPAPVPIQKPK